MVVDVTEEVEEAMARRLCEADGNPPDGLATMLELATKSVPGGIAKFIPEYGIRPCWEFYVHLAREALR